MKLSRYTLLRAILPMTVFVIGIESHFLWHACRFSANRAVYCSSETVCSNCDLLAAATATETYFKNQNEWLGIACALPLALAAVALRRFREQRVYATHAFFFGGVTVSGFLAASGCFLTGCCGSPMLAVYANLFGIGVLTLAKPSLALLSASFVAVAWYRMNKKHVPLANNACTLKKKRLDFIFKKSTRANAD